MNKQKQATICFADISIGFCFPCEIDVPKEFEEFLLEEKADVNVEYEIRLLDKPLQLSEIPVSSYSGMQVYPTEEGVLRNYTPLTEKDGCQVACLLRKNQKHTLYYPSLKWDYYSQELHLLHLIGIEEVLIRHQALLLHSSVVKLGEHTVLFSGPSGIGKSTQAKLW